ncbi:hypothetical protein GF420_02940 [candidate division GN15 bacterium]|nr:hypothetical protein [candidate division GN15 bacterium]
MPHPVLDAVTSGKEIDALRLDLSCLVGHTVSIYSEQFPGTELQTRVMAYAGRDVHISNAGSGGKIDNLVHRQTVVVKFAYKGQQIAVRAKLKRSQGGRCFLALDERVVPLAQRRFVRMPMVRPVNLAPYPNSSFGPVDIARLRWIQTESINISSGGALVQLSNYLQPDIYLLMHFDLPKKLLPDLVLAKVRHCYQIDFSGYKVGVEFVVREATRKAFPRNRLENLPPAVFSYTASDREKRNYEIQAWMHSGKAR